MNKEVKRTLTYMKQYVEEPNVPDDSGEYPDAWEFYPEEIKCVLDYITSLEEKVETEHKAYMGTVQELTETATRIDKALHRIQLLQMDGEVFIKDLGLIVRDLKGSDK